MKAEHAIHKKQIPVTFTRRGEWLYETEERPVRVMARAEGWAMVRRKGATPYCCPEKELHAVNGSESHNG